METVHRKRQYFICRWIGMFVGNLGKGGNMQMIQIALYIATLLLVSGVCFLFVRWYREERKMRAERAKCFVMISCCSRLISLLRDTRFGSPVDFAFLRRVIFRKNVDIHFIFREPFLSEEEKVILSEGLRWVNCLRREVEDSIKEEMNRDEQEYVWNRVQVLRREGFAAVSRNRNRVCEELEQQYYMLLLEMFARVACTRSDPDRKELVGLCGRAEVWALECGSLYLSGKVRECREWLAAG